MLVSKCFIKVILLILSLLTLFSLFSCNDDKTNKVKELVVCSYGGSFQEAQRKAFFKPFEEETGIKIREASWSGEYAKIKAMVESKNVIWDLVTAAESSIIQRGIHEGILEKISYKNIDKSRFIPESITEYSVGFDYYSTVLSYSLIDYPIGSAHPTSWKDFWDIKKFPGARCLRNDPRTTLEFALLADGVPMDQLYPLDLDRAFKSLDKIKNNVSVWWVSGHQPAQLLADKEVKMVSAFNGRIWSAAQNDKIPVNVEWNQGCLDVDAWIIPKGAKNYDEAIKLIEYTSRPEVQIELTKYISYSPTLPKAFDKLDKSVHSVLPTSPENKDKQFFFNGKWWAENESHVNERWNEWLLTR